MLVVGPVYLDHMLAVDGPLGPIAGPRINVPCDRVILDHSVYERRRHNWPPDRLLVHHATGQSIQIVAGHQKALPETGSITTDRLLGASLPWHRRVRLLGYRRMSGGMGAGFAAALRCRLISAAGSDLAGVPDADARFLAAELRKSSVDLTWQSVPQARTDSTLVLTNGRLGDKLAIGRRQILGRFEHNAVMRAAIERAQVVCVAGVASRLAASVFDQCGPKPYVVWAPTWRNVPLDPALAAQKRIDYLACNEREWEALHGARWFGSRVPLVTITRGRQGASVFYRDDQRRQCRHDVPAFGAAIAPVNTNHAGEAFAAAFLACLVDLLGPAKLPDGRLQRQWIHQAATEAAVAAHLQVQTAGFGFADRRQIHAAMR